MAPQSPAQARMLYSDGAACRERGLDETMTAESLDA